VFYPDQTGPDQKSAGSRTGSKISRIPDRIRTDRISSRLLTPTTRITQKKLCDWRDVPNYHFYSLSIPRFQKYWGKHSSSNHLGWLGKIENNWEWEFVAEAGSVKPKVRSKCTCFFIHQRHQRSKSAEETWTWNPHSTSTKEGTPFADYVICERPPTSAYYIIWFDISS
jgi:hypothetical protein